MKLKYFSKTKSILHFAAAFLLTANCLLPTASYAQPRTLDNTFNQGTGANNSVLTSAIQSDGKIIVGGSFTSYNETTRNYIARLNTDGTFDNTFNSGTGANNIVFSTTVQSDGKIIIGGGFVFYNGTTRKGIARLNLDGTLDSTFNTGTGASFAVKTTAIQSDGKIIIGGFFTFYNGTSRNYIARLNTDGTLDTVFNIGTGANSYVSTTAIQSDGKIIIGGDFTFYNGTTRKGIARLNVDGTIDSTFNTGVGANGTVHTFSIQSDGKIIIGGDFTSYNGTIINHLARLNTDGTLDATFNLGTGADTNIYTIIIQSDGKIIIGGDFTSYNGTIINHLARLNTNGILDSTFNTGTGANGVVRTTAIQSDGKIIIGGLFTSYNGTGRNRIARLLNCSPVTRTASSTICSGDSIFLQGIYQTTAGTYHDTLTAVNACDSIVTTTLTVLPANTISQTKTICAGQSVSVWKNTYTKSGTYIDTLTSITTCDSTVTTIITEATPSTCDLVWPGDANHDGVTNNLDLLAIGVAYGKTGTVRSGATLNWIGQPAANWADTLSNGVNDKHVDCDGNGSIKISDIPAIIKNYGFTHNKTFAGSTPSPSDPTLSLNIANNTVKSGTPVKALVELGTSTVAASNIYGIAFTVNFDPALVDSASLGFDIANSWLGTKNTNVIALDYTNFSNGSIDLAVTKIDHSNANGFGTIGELTFNTSTNFTGNKTLNLSVSKVKMISKNETDLPVNLGKDVAITTGINAIQQEEISVKILPNPFQSSATVIIEGLNSNEPLSFELYDLIGKRVKQIDGISTKQFTLTKENLQSGIYFYKVFSSKEFISTGRVVVVE